MKYCKQCGAANSNEANKCDKCGSHDFEYKCEKCGTMFANMDSCPNCGLRAGSRKKICQKCGRLYFTDACPNCGYVRDPKEATVRKQLNVAGLIGMILGILGLCFSLLGTGYILGIPAVLLGVIGLIIAKKKGIGKGFAVAAVVLGGVALLVSILMTAACRTVSENLNEISYYYHAVGGDSEAKGEMAKVDYPETVLIDNEYCRFTINSIDPDDAGDYTLKATILNKSGKDLRFAIRDATVNGYMISPFWGGTVEAGTASDQDITFSGDSIRKTGTTEVTSIRFQLIGYDTRDWFTYLVDEILTVCPMGESAVREYPREARDSDIVLIDNDSCRIVIYEIGHRPLFGYTVYLYMENKTDERLLFSLEDAAINGIRMDPVWTTEVTAGNRAYSYFSWFDGELEENGIRAIGDLILHMKVYNENDMFADPLVDKSITVLP